MKLIVFYSPENPQCRQFLPMVGDYCKELGIEVESYNLLEKADNIGFRKYRVNSVPTVLFVNDEGYVHLKRIQGVPAMAAFERFLKE